MPVLPNLCLLAVRQLLPGACAALGIAVGESAIDAVAGFLTERFSDQSRRLCTALEAASARAWKALEVALAGESFWNWLDRADDRALRRQIRLFLDGLPHERPADAQEFRRYCVAELRAARRAGHLGGTVADLRDLARRTADLARFGDPQHLLQADRRILRDVATELAELGYADLAQLLDLRPVEDCSLLAVAVRYFFRRAVEEDPRLFRGLTWASWEDLASAQQHGFAQLHHALAENGQALEARLEELAGFMAGVAAAMRDIRQEQQRQGEQFREMYEAIQEIQRRLEVSVRDDAERRLVEQVLARYRALPVDRQRQMPALVQSVAGAQLHLGAAEVARRNLETFRLVVLEGKTKAEAHFHACQAALERRDWRKALSSYHEANRLDAACWTVERLLRELNELVPPPPPEVAAQVARL